MPTSFEVRRYRPGDGRAVWDVHEAALRASPLAFVEEPAVDEDVLAIESHYLDAGGEFLVGTFGPADTPSGERGSDAIVAIGGYLPVDDDTVEVKRMRVHPDHQREGYASAILSELEDRARADGYETAVLETIESLRAAREFYDDAGYEVVETWEDEVTGVDRYRYRKPLSRPD